MYKSMSKIRRQRVADQIQVIISELFLRELSDPRLTGLSVTDVAIDRELQYADVYVNTWDREIDRDKTILLLEKATGFLRYQLGQRIRLRTVPNLHFHWDTLLEQAEAVDSIFDTLDIPPEEPIDN